MESTPKSLARDVMLQHVFCFPDDMDGERCEIERRFDVAAGGVVVASFQRLEFEIVKAIEAGIAAEREACAKLADEGADYGTAAGAEDMARTIAKLIRNRSEG